MGSAVQMAVAMAAVTATWIGVAAALVGMGCAVRAAVRESTPRAGAGEPPRSGTEDEPAAELAVLFWTGYAAAVAVLQLWHCVRPITGLVAGPLLVIGWGAAATLGRPFVARLGATLRAAPRTSLVAAVLVLWAAMHALGPGDAHDSGTYHYAVLQWLGREAIVPGLGNLAVTFAHNSAHLLLGAAIDTGPWSGRSEHVLNGLLVFAMTPLAVRGLAAAWSGGGWVRWVDALLIVPVVYFVLAKDICSPKTDAAPAFLVLLLTRQSLVLLARAPDRSSGREWLLVQLATFGAAAIVVKLSAAAFVAALCPMMLWLTRSGQRVRTVVLGAGAGILLVGPWVGRNVVLSGYPLFPLRVAAVDADWTVPARRLAAFDFGVQSKTTLPRLGYRALDRLVDVPDGLRFELRRGDAVTATNWIPGWLVTLPAHSPLGVLVPAALGLASAGLVALRRRRTSLPRAPLVLLLPLGAALVFWFASAPDPRYGLGLTWSLASICVAFAVCSRLDPGGARRAALVLAVAPGLLAALVWGAVGRRLRLGDEHPFVATLFEGPGPDHGFHPRPSVETTTWESRHGVVVRRPAVGRRIWAAEQPAVGWPAPPDGLAYRDPGDPSAGFRIEAVSPAPPR